MANETRARLQAVALVAAVAGVLLAPSAHLLQPSTADAVRPARATGDVPVDGSLVASPTGQDGSSWGGTPVSPPEALLLTARTPAAGSQSSVPTALHAPTTTVRSEAGVGRCRTQPGLAWFGSRDFLSANTTALIDQL